MYKINMTKKIISTYFLIIFIIIISLACGSQKGEFAFKFSLDDAFRKIKGNVEFPYGQEVQWAYIYKEIPASKKVGVILLKKEIVWVEKSVKSDHVDRSKKVIFGTISNLEEGRYKIMLTDILKEKRIDEVEFVIYNDKKDDEFE